MSSHVWHLLVLVLLSNTTFNSFVAVFYSGSTVALSSALRLLSISIGQSSWSMKVALEVECLKTVVLNADFCSRSDVNKGGIRSRIMAIGPYNTITTNPEGECGGIWNLVLLCQHRHDQNNSLSTSPSSKPNIHLIRINRSSMNIIK